MPFLHRTVAKQIQQELRLIVYLIAHVEFHALYSDIHCPQQMLCKQAPKLIHAVFILRQSHHFPKGHLKYPRRIDFHQVIERVFKPRKRHPVTAHRNPLSCQLGRITVFHKPFHESFIPGKPRPSVPVFKQIPHSL